MLARAEPKPEEVLLNGGHKTGFDGLRQTGGYQPFAGGIYQAIAKANPVVAPKPAAPRPAAISMPRPVAPTMPTLTAPRTGVPEGWTPGIGSDGWGGMLDGSGTLAGIGLDMNAMGNAYDSFISANAPQPQQGGFFSGLSTPGLIGGALGLVAGGPVGALGGWGNWDASTYDYRDGYNSRGERSHTGERSDGGATVGDGSYSESSGRNDNNPQGIL
jgi:hypothetical protein